MSSSIPEYFDPPEWATKEETIKAARHIINYWMLEAKARNGQWLNEMEYSNKLRSEIRVLQAKVDWLAKADKLVVWDGENWQIRNQPPAN